MPQRFTTFVIQFFVELGEVKVRVLRVKISGDNVTGILSIQKFFETHLGHPFC